MTVCYTRIPFPIPSGLLQRPVVTAYAGETDLSPYDATYVVAQVIDDEREQTDDQGTPTCCGGIDSIVWPSSERIGALYPVAAGDYEFTATVDTGVDGRVKLTPALLTVVGAECSQVECAPCSLEADCPPCPGECAEVQEYYMLLSTDYYPTTLVPTDMYVTAVSESASYTGTALHVYVTGATNLGTLGDSLVSADIMVVPSGTFTSYVQLETPDIFTLDGREYIHVGLVIIYPTEASGSEYMGQLAVTATLPCDVVLSTNMYFKIHRG